MVRPLRIEYAGAIFHVMSRGNARQAIFKDAIDRDLAKNPRLKKDLAAIELRIARKTRS